MWKFMRSAWFVIVILKLTRNLHPMKKTNKTICAESIERQKPARINDHLCFCTYMHRDYMVLSWCLSFCSLVVSLLVSISPLWFLDNKNSLWGLPPPCFSSKKDYMVLRNSRSELKYCYRAKKLATRKTKQTLTKQTWISFADPNSWT
jgi:hypothetical protein